MGKVIALILILFLTYPCYADITVVSDTFTEASDTTLTSHTSDSGSAWSRTIINTNDMTVVGSGDYARGNSPSSSALAIATTSPSQAEYWVTAGIYDAKTIYPGLLGRASSSTNTMYQLFYFNDTGAWTLQKIVSGTTTDIGTYSGLAPSTLRVVKLELLNATKKVYIDGVERISSNDNVITATGYGGIRGRNGMRLDNFKVEEAGASTVTNIINSATINNATFF